MRKNLLLTSETIQNPTKVMRFFLAAIFFMILATAMVNAMSIFVKAPAGNTVTLEVEPTDNVSITPSDYTTATPIILKYAKGGFLSIPLAGIDGTVETFQHESSYNWNISVDGVFQGTYTEAGLATGEYAMILIQGLNADLDYHIVEISPVVPNYGWARAFACGSSLASVPSLGVKITEILQDPDIAYMVSATNTGHYFRYYQYDLCQSLMTAVVESLPNSVTSIGNYFRCGQYRGCTKLETTVEESLPSSVESIGSYFRTNQYYGCTSLTTASAEFLPNSVTSIGLDFRSHQYRECTKLETTAAEYLPSNITLIPGSFRYCQYEHCTSLTTAAAEFLPSNITSIQGPFRSAQYSNCTSLTTAAVFVEPTSASKSGSYRLNQYFYVPLGTAKIQKTGSDVTTAYVGDVLAVENSLLFDLAANNPDGAPLWSYQWKRDGNEIPSATSATYTPIADDLGTDITVTLTTNISSIDNNTTVTSAPVAIDVLPTPPTSGILYVKPDGTGNGSSWADASGDLQEMINVSVENDQIWVAAGTYKPNRQADNITVIVPDRSNAFVLKKDVKIYGGFAGYESSIADRNWANNITTLSGDIDNDGTLNEGNAYHIVISAGDVGDALLDGFTITGGNAFNNNSISVNSQTIEKSYGGGIYIINSNPTLNNIIIVGNKGDSGGGIYNYSSSPVLTNVIISGNISDYGGGIYNVISSPMLTNVIVSGNNATYDGGGMYNDSSSPILTNVTISGNTANRDGGGIFNIENSFPVLNNTIVWGNGSNNIDNDGSTPIYKYSLVEGSGGSSSWDSSFGTDGGNNIDTDPQFVGSGNNSLQPVSPAVNAGDNALYLTARGIGNFTGEKDLAGNPRLFGANIDMGAYEAQFPQEATPEAIIDYENETLTPLINGGIYSFNGGANVTLSGTTYSIEEAWMNGNLIIIKKGDGSTTVDSDPQTLLIPARPVAPTTADKTDETIAGSNDGTLTGVTAAMEYKSSLDAIWTGGTGSDITNLTPGDYQVRIKAVTGTSFASSVQTLTIGAGAAQTSELTVTAPAFTNETYGYTPPAAKAITIANGGNSTAIISTTVTVSTTDFIIAGSGPTVSAGGSINTWTVQPAAGLAAGPHTATITVTYDGTTQTTATADVSFEVDKKPISITVTDQAPVTYGTTVTPAYTFDNPLVTGDSFTGALSITGSKSTSGNWTASSHDIEQGTLAIDDSNNGDNYDVTFIGKNFTVNPLTLTHNVAVVPSKVYDGTNAAGHTGDLTNVIGSDDVTLSATLIYTASADVQTGGEINKSTWEITGTDAANYDLPTFTPQTASITPATGALVISQSDIVFGDPLSPQIVSQTGTGTVSYQYKVQGADDATYSAIKPTVVGLYTVRGQAAATLNYTAATSAPINFVIAPNADQLAVAAAKLLLENATYIVAQTTANTPSTVQTWLSEQINNLLSGTGVSASDIAVANFTAAEGGTWLNPPGKDGGFSFTVTLSSGIITDTAGQSGSITAISYAPTVPGRPIEVTATPGDGQATVKFTPVSNGGTPIQFYTVTSEPEGITATGGFSPIIVTGLTNGVEYTFTVTATNAIGTSEASAPSNVITPRVATGIATVETWRATSLHAVSINGGLQILGLVPGEVFSVYTLQGKLIYQGKAIAEEQFVRIPATGVYLILAGEQRIKAIR